MAVPAERLAEALRFGHPDAEPGELDPDTLSRWVRDAGHDPDDAELVAGALAHWELLMF